MYGNLNEEICARDTSGHREQKPWESSQVRLPRNTGARRTENAPKPRSPRKKHASTVHKAAIEGRTRLDYDIIV